MSRLSTAELERLKQSVSLVSLLESEGYKLHRQGKDYVMCCPFHQEKTPSFSVSVVKNCYHCFGCGASGSVLDYVMQSQRLSMGKAIGYLQSVSGQLPSVTQSSSLAAPAGAQAGTVAACERGVLTDIDDDGQALLHQVVEHYHNQLVSSVEAKEWLVKRGLTDPELLTHFKLGYAGLHGIAPVMPSKSSKAGKQMRERLEGLGVVRASTHQDHFRGCFMVPVIGFSEAANMAQRGKVLQLYGRRTQPDYKIKSGSPKHLYLPSALGGVWNEACLVGCDSVILCEALIDAMTVWCAGSRNVISSYGVNGFTDDHLTALLHHQVKAVYIAYDRDEAGDKAAEKLAVMLAEHGILCYRVVFPKGTDANEFLVSSGNPKKSLDLLLGQAQPLNAVVSVNAGVDVAGSGVDKLSDDIPYQTLSNGELLLTFGHREWRLKGVEKNLSATSMKIHAQVRDVQSGLFHIDQLELYQAKARSLFIRQACSELGCDESVIKRDLGRVLLLLEQLQDKALSEAEQNNSGSGAAVELDDEQTKLALELLCSPDLISRIADDLASCGVVGECNNLLAGYLAAVSRKLDKPLAVLIQSSSAAGKSSLMDAVLSLIPEEERVQYSAMTGQSLFYLGETNLQHKILAIAEEEGVRQAAYALKLLQSDGELTIASTGKDEKSGSLVTKQYTVKGPVMLILTTTAIDVDEELLNRCLVLSVNESESQTKAIHALQRHSQTLDGLLAESERKYLTALHQNAQRLLKPLKVVNPYANELTFLSDKTRTRRDHMKYLTLIQSITLLHQYQRPIKRLEHRGKLIEYIEVTLDDIRLANELAHAILGRTLDEMPPQTRKLLNLLKGWVTVESERQSIKQNEYRFSRRDVRAYTHWGDTQLKIHLGRLVEMEYLSLYRKGLSYEYSLLYDGEDNGDSQCHLCGLLAVEQLKQPGQTDDKAPSDKTDNKVNDNKITPEEDAGKAKRSGQKKERSATGRGKVGGQSGSEKQLSTQAVSGLAAQPVGQDKNAVIRTKPKKRKTSPPAAKQSNPKTSHQQAVTHG